MTLLFTRLPAMFAGGGPNGIGGQRRETFMPARGVKGFPQVSAKTNGSDLNSIPKFFCTAKSIINGNS